MEYTDNHHRAILERIAQRVMLEKGLLPEFSAAVMQEVERLSEQPLPDTAPILDLRHLLWFSVDNDDSLDLDQLTASEPLPGERIKILAAIADVDSLVKDRSAIDAHARQNTTSVYTAARIFPMLPEKLSTDLTSLNFAQDRRAIVIEMVVEKDGAVYDSGIYQALVHNHAKLAYPSVADWLEGEGPLPGAAAAAGLADSLRLQDEAARRLGAYRHSNGALTLRTLESRPVFDGDQISGLQADDKNRAKELIENIMIAANSVTARFLAEKNFPLIRRVVRTPRRWERIVALAAEYGATLPMEPDSKALEAFLVRRRAADPEGFTDLSISIVKLLGPGEYAAGMPDDAGAGHFGLAVRDYAHSTAPNRRYTDLVTHRLLKAAIEGQPAPYDLGELNRLAEHCTRTEDIANKVERQIGKSAAALLLRSRIGEQFEAVVTGAAAKGTWVRLLHLPVEGRLVKGFERLDVGDRLKVQLIMTDVEQGYIDFKNAHAFRRQ